MDHKTIYVLVNSATGGFDLGGSNRRAVRAYRTYGQAKAARTLIQKDYPNAGIIVCEYNLKDSENA